MAVFLSSLRVATVGSDEAIPSLRSAAAERQSLAGDHRHPVIYTSDPPDDPNDPVIYPVGAVVNPEVGVGQPEIWGFEPRHWHLRPERRSKRPQTSVELLAGPRKVNHFADFY